MPCSAQSCGSRSDTKEHQTPGISFHTFPKYTETRNQWIRAIRRVNWEPKKNDRLCSKHFEESCFVEGLKRKRLKPDAVPTKFEDYSLPRASTSKAKGKRQATELQNLELTPKRKKILEENDVAQDMNISPRRTIKILNSFSKTKELAARRLRTIKKNIY